MGIEIYGKTLGVVGIGNIGAIVAEKALALGMRVLAYDIFISKEFAESKGIELVDFDTLLKESDFIYRSRPAGERNTKSHQQRCHRKDEKERDHHQRGTGPGCQRKGSLSMLSRKAV